mgnify:CR=1 FL=1
MPSESAEDSCRRPEVPQVSAVKTAGVLAIAGLLSCCYWPLEAPAATLAKFNR